MIEEGSSRKMSHLEHYEHLQLEFISYYFRMLLYDQSFKPKYLDFCKKKKETIVSISLKKGFHNIFTNENSRQKYFDRFFINDSFGLPDFKYRDEYQKKNSGYWDKKSYFKEGVNVIWKEEEYVIVRNKFNYNDPSVNFVVIKQEGKPCLKVLTSEVKREWDLEKIDINLLEIN